MDFFELLIDLLVFYGIFRALFGKKKKVAGKKQPQLPNKQREMPLEDEVSPEYPETALYKEDSEDVCLHDLEYEYEDEADEPVEPINMPAAEPKPVKPQVKVYGSLGEMLHDMQSAMTELSETVTGQTKKSRRRRTSGRKAAEPAVAKAQEECDYCTGEEQVECVFDSELHSDIHAGKASKPATPLVIADSEAVQVDVAAVQKRLKLSDMQSAIVWKEILDKPVALRRNRR
jgi:hypothetical protein